MTTFAPIVGFVVHGGGAGTVLGLQHFAWHESTSVQTSVLTAGLGSVSEPQEKAEHSCLHVYAAAGGCRLPELHA